MDDYEEHDHEFVCDWDLEKIKNLGERIDLLEKELKEVKGNLKFTYEEMVKLRKDFPKVVGILLRNLKDTSYSKVDTKILNELFEGD